MIFYGSFLCSATFPVYFRYIFMSYYKRSHVFQTLLKAKDNEVEYLKKEISCLQNEVQSLTKVCFEF